MNSQKKIYLKTSLLSLAGVGLLVLAFFAPDAGGNPGSFFRVAMQTKWQDVLDWPAMWCSLKIIMFSAGLFLLIESTGTVLAVKNFKSLALPVFMMQAVPCLGFLFGSYYLIKSLL